MSLRPYVLEFLSSITGDRKSKIVILGATSWLGRTLAYMLSELNFDLHLVASEARMFEVDSKLFKCEAYSIEKIRHFAPDYVFDFAFITREHLARLGAHTYIELNKRLIDQALEVYSLESVRAGAFSSSGAAHKTTAGTESTLEIDPYGALKRITEDLVQIESSKLGKQALIMKPWSVSGPLVTKTDAFAFSSFINQARSGRISIRSKAPVVRRYCSVDDFLALSLAELIVNPKTFSVLESGGPSTSLQELAIKIASLSQRPVLIESEIDNGLEPDIYISDNLIWTEICKLHNFSEEALDEQILRCLTAMPNV